MIGAGRRRRARVQGADAARVRLPVPSSFTSGWLPPPHSPRMASPTRASGVLLHCGFGEFPSSRAPLGSTIAARS